MLSRVAKALLSHPGAFSSIVLGMPLRAYQLEPLQAIIDSVLNRRGLEFLCVFPRQSGKNELVAHMLVYLLNILRRAGGSIVYAATGDGLGIGIDRLETRLNNRWNRHDWYRRSRPDRRCLGDTCISFLSSHPAAATRGHTAHWLLVVDETQDADPAHMESVFTPMRAANNATAVYIGTVRTTTDYLAAKRRQLTAATAADRIRRVFLVPPAHVCAEVPAYKTFLDAQIARHGRNHPIVASEYFLEPIDSAAGLLPPRRRRLLAGRHPRADAPLPGVLYVATLDVAGIQEETPEDPTTTPTRDYTLATLFEVDLSLGPLPTYRAMDVFVDHGSGHFAASGTTPPLAARLAAWLDFWHVAHLVADASGVGQGLVSWLAATRGAATITPIVFSPAAKGRIGSAFLSLVETRRVSMWTGDENQPLSDGWWFWRQAEACTLDIPPAGIEKMRWSVPTAHRTPTPTGPQPTHDDRLVSFALIAELDRLLRSHQIQLGTGASALVPGRDPLGDPIY